MVVYFKNRSDREYKTDMQPEKAQIHLRLPVHPKNSRKLTKYSMHKTKNL
jgi:hypothetical protein